MKALPLLRDPNMYREYLEKAMTGNAQPALDASLVTTYAPDHDYTSTLHPVPARTLGDSLPPPPPPAPRFDATRQLSSEPQQQQQHFAHSQQRSDFSMAHNTGAHGSKDSLQSNTTTFNRRFKEHIYEMPKFPDTNRAQSADAAIAYSPMTSDSHNNNRTT